MIPFEPSQSPLQGIRLPTTVAPAAVPEGFAEVWNTVEKGLDAQPLQSIDVGTTVLSEDAAIAGEDVSPTDENDDLGNRASLDQKGHDLENHKRQNLDETGQQQVGQPIEAKVIPKETSEKIDVPPAKFEARLAGPKTHTNPDPSGTEIVSRKHNGGQMSVPTGVAVFQQQAATVSLETGHPQLLAEGVSKPDTQVKQGANLLAPEAQSNMAKISTPRDPQYRDAPVARRGLEILAQAVSTPLAAPEKTVTAIPTLQPSTTHLPSKADSSPEVRNLASSAAQNSFIQNGTQQPNTSQPVSISHLTGMPLAVIDPVVEPFLTDEPELLLSNGLNPTTSGRSLTAHSMQSHAQPVVQQIVAAMVQTKTGLTEIALNPQELGRVRMKLKVIDSGVSVSIIAERPETADLMRRNIEALAREFREIGYDSVSFSFDDQSSRSDDESERASINNSPAEHLPFDADPTASPTPVAIRSGLDLKL